MKLNERIRKKVVMTWRPFYDLQACDCLLLKDVKQAFTLVAGRLVLGN